MHPSVLPHPTPTDCPRVSGSFAATPQATVTPRLWICGGRSQGGGKLNQKSIHLSIHASSCLIFLSFTCSTFGLPSVHYNGATISSVVLLCYAPLLAHIKGHSLFVWMFVCFVKHLQERILNTCFLGSRQGGSRISLQGSTVIELHATFPTEQSAPIYVKQQTFKQIFSSNREGLARLCGGCTHGVHRRWLHYFTVAVQPLCNLSPVHTP